jgi:hypothetical protein
MERSSNNSHLQEKRKRRPEEMEANSNHGLHLSHLYMPDGENLLIDELATGNLC